MEPHSFEVHATDAALNVDPVPAKRNFTVKVTAAIQPGAPGGSVTPTATAKDAAVSASASATKSQKQKGKKIVVALTVAAQEALKADVAGAVAAKKSFKLKSQSATVAAGRKKILKLRPSGKDGARIAKALKAKKKATATLNVVLTDQAGNSSKSALKIRLTR